MDVFSNFWVGILPLIQYVVTIIRILKSHSVALPVALRTPLGDRK